MEYCFGVFARSDGPVGLITLWRYDSSQAEDECDLGFLIDRRWRGRGIATDAGELSLKLAFQELGLAVVRAAAKPSNPASLRVLEKLGFEYRCVLPRYVGLPEPHALFERRRPQGLHKVHTA
jgi:ribosomal-protein-alanine N-acetyltransferase